MINLENTIISQYANSPILLALINSINAEIDPAVNFQNFISNVWNAVTDPTPNTDNITYGLDLWGRIVGVNRILAIPLSSTGFFGFSEAYLAGVYSWLGFNDGVQTDGTGGPLWDGATSGTAYKMLNPLFQQVILAKALTNISACSAPALNHVLTTLFGSQGRCYVMDNGNMTMTIVLEFTPPINSPDYPILEQSYAITHPVGVGVYLAVGYQPQTTFGFASAGTAPYSNGPAPFGQGTMLSSPFTQLSI